MDDGKGIPIPTQNGDNRKHLFFETLIMAYFTKKNYTLGTLSFYEKV